jgi:hypothetical protein
MFLSSDEVYMEWSDLVINTTSEEIIRSYSQWPQNIGDTIKPIMITAFGDFFFTKSDGIVM